MLITIFLITLFAGLIKSRYDLEKLRIELAQLNQRHTVTREGVREALDRAILMDETVKRLR